MACESGHWIRSVISEGRIIELEDGTSWRVNDFDTLTSRMWFSTSNVMVCYDGLVNTSDNESVRAARID